jgi:hypothetical protein
MMISCNVPQPTPSTHALLKTLTLLPLRGGPLPCLQARNRGFVTFKLTGRWCPPSKAGGPFVLRN